MDPNTIEAVKPLRRASHNHTEWNCCICTDGEQYERPFLTREDDLVCSNCISAIFGRALQHDAEWPARWGSEELDHHDFASVLSQGFAFQYHCKGLELVAERAVAQAEPLEGLVLGRDYQICPTCKRAVCLEDGCSHVVCRCGASFCFVCGVVALDDGSGHWSRGGCPRYNALGSGLEDYDSDDDADSDSSGEDESSNESSSEDEEDDEDEYGDDSEDMTSIDAQDALQRLQDAGRDFNFAMQTWPEYTQDRLREFQESDSTIISVDESRSLSHIISMYSFGYHDPQGWDRDEDRRHQSRGVLLSL
jgi:hypothetical protein